MTPTKKKKAPAKKKAPKKKKSPAKKKKAGVKKKKSRAKKAPGTPAKKAPKVKTPAKKKGASKSVVGRTTKATLQLYDVQDVPDEQHFYFVNGHRVKNVKELAEVMDWIEQEVFDYHVNDERNDFYSWVKHVFDDVELAEKLIGATGPKHLQFTIYKHVADKALKKKK